MIQILVNLVIPISEQIYYYTLQLRLKLMWISVMNKYRMGSSIYFNPTANIEQLFPRHLCHPTPFYPPQ